MSDRFCCVLFFFYCCGDHRDLHSFPTRRSSDLKWIDEHVDGKLYGVDVVIPVQRSEEHTSELQSQSNIVCRLLLEKKKSFPCPPPTTRHASSLPTRPSSGAVGCYPGTMPITLSS